MLLSKRDAGAAVLLGMAKGSRSAVSAPAVTARLRQPVPPFSDQTYGENWEEVGAVRLQFLGASGSIFQVFLSQSGRGAALGGRNAAMWEPVPVLSICRENGRGEGETGSNNSANARPRTSTTLIFSSFGRTPFWSSTLSKFHPLAALNVRPPPKEAERVRTNQSRAISKSRGSLGKHPEGQHTNRRLSRARHHVHQFSCSPAPEEQSH